jgi:hypothetical protein
MSTSVGTPTQETWGPVVSDWHGCDGCGGGPHGEPMGCCDACGPCCGDCCTDCCSGGGWWGKRLFDLCTQGCGCCDDCCSCCDCCLPRKSSFYASAEYLLWTVKSAGMPSLVTVNTLGNFPAFNVPGTALAYGGDSVGTNLRSGGRFTVGVAAPYVSNTGLEVSYFFLANRTTSASFSGTGAPGSPSIGRPFVETGPFLSVTPDFTPIAGNQSAQIVAGNSLFFTNTTGRVAVTTSNDLWGLEANVRHNVMNDCWCHLDVLWGFRYISLIEDLTIAEDLNTIGTTNPNLLPGPVGFPAAGATRFQVADHFHTRNEFFGGQVGLDGEFRWRRFFLGVNAKLGVGTMHQVVVINGQTAITQNGVQSINSGGLLAQPSNIGRFGRDTFALVPEVGLKVGYNFTDRLRGYIGYDVLYMSSVVRPGDQVDTNVNSNFLPPRGPGLVPGPALPRFQFRTNDFWAQGVCFGITWSY